MAIIGAVLGDIAGRVILGGGIAEEFYHRTGFDEDRLLLRYLNEYLYKIVKA